MLRNTHTEQKEHSRERGISSRAWDGERKDGRAEWRSGVRQAELLLYFAYFLVHSLAVLSCSSLSYMYCCAIDWTSGSLGLASVSSEQMESSTLAMVRAGLQLSFRMSRQIAPALLMLQLKRHTGKQKAERKLSKNMMMRVALEKRAAAAGVVYVLTGRFEFGR